MVKERSNRAGARRNDAVENSSRRRKAEGYGSECGESGITPARREDDLVTVLAKIIAPTRFIHL